MFQEADGRSRRKRTGTPRCILVALGDRLAIVAAVLALLPAAPSMGAVPSPRPDGEVATRQEVREADYHIQWQGDAPLDGAGGAWRAANPAHGFDIYFTDPGVRVLPQGAAATWEWGLDLVGYGRGDAAWPVEPARLLSGENRMEYERGEIVEWYVNDAAGLKQGFTLAARPQETPSVRAQSPLGITGTNEGAVVLILAVKGDLSPIGRPGGQAIDFVSPGARLGTIHYSALRVSDMNGRELPASMQVVTYEGQPAIRLTFDDAAATYPVTVDPLATSATWSSSEADGTYSVAWGDWDADGDLDVAVGNAGGPNRVYRNTAGVLSLAWSSTETDDTWSVAWGDWDGDGDLDLAVGNRWEPNRVYDNTGGDLTLAWTSTETDYTRSVAWGDWNGDGDLDLVVGNKFEPNRVYVNGGGALSLAWSSSEMDNTESVAWGDWDGDGDLDLAVGNSGSNRVYRNTGGSLSLAWSSTEEDQTLSVAWGDWDGDGDLDLAVGNWNSWRNRIYRNTGGALSLAWSSTEMENTSSVAWGDWDGDGDLDLAVGNGGEANHVYRNTGGALSLAWSSTETDDTFSVAWGDWDRDGDLDLAVANVGEPNRVYRNTGGALSLVWSSAETDDSRSVAWGDWDGDGDLDLAVGNSDNQRNRVYRNTAGALSLAWSSTETDDTWGVAWGDWDGDGDLDLAVGNRLQPNRVYRNTGGGLVLAWSSTESDDTRSVAWGDWDGDGDLDLATGSNTDSCRVYINTGADFSLGWSGAWHCVSVAWGDWDGDGDLDLALGLTGYSNMVYRNTGGALSLAWSSTETDDTWSVAWGDWDGDGDLDLAVGNYGSPNRVYVNTGGALSLAWSSTEAEETVSVAWGDWDGDGDVDLAVGSLFRRNRVYSNGSMTRLGRLPETPTRPDAIDRPGATAAASFHSAAERLDSPVFIDYRLHDEQSDVARQIVPEYSLTGGGEWLPATQGTGGDGTTGRAASPSGISHIFSWDAQADAACSEAVTFRIGVLWQAPQHAGGPLQRAAMAATTPPFRLACTRSYRDRDGDGLGDPADTRLDWSVPAGYVTLAGDCDDANPHCTMDCADSDADGYCTPHDNCPSVVNVLQLDFDSDLVGDACDCAPDDPGTTTMLGPARNLRFVSRSGLEWDPPVDDGGGGLVFDLLRSTSASDWDPATCLQTSTPETSASDPETPSDIAFYLIRAEGACGDNLGTDSVERRRLGGGCEPPLPEVVQIDVESIFTADVIANDGAAGGWDGDESSVDAWGSWLITQSAAVSQYPADPDGLPDDGFFPANAFHPDVQLAYRNDDNGWNAGQLHTDGASLSFPVPVGRYLDLHLFLVSGDGWTDASVELTYDDGLATVVLERVADWFDDQAEVPDRYSLINDLDRFTAALGYDDSNDPAVLGLRCTPDSERRLQSVRLIRTASAEPGITVLSLLGATGLREAE